jgi:hypothetical protein
MCVSSSRGRGRIFDLLCDRNSGGLDRPKKYVEKVEDKGFNSIYSRGKYISIALIELLTFWLRSAATGMGDRCRCGGFVEVGIG